MIDEKNIIDLSDFGERDIKEEFAHIKDSIMALEKLIDAKEKEPDDKGNSLSRQLRATIRENMEELNLPIEAKCDALEAKLNGIQDSINQIKTKQESAYKVTVTNMIMLAVILLLVLYIFLFRFLGA